MCPGGGPTPDCGGDVLGNGAPLVMLINPNDPAEDDGRHQDVLGTDGSLLCPVTVLITNFM
jgi:hypothetical protein